MNFGKKNLDEIETLRETYKKREISSDEKIQIFRFGDKFYSTMHVLPRFETKILTHVISVYLQDKDTYLSPVFLVVEGNAGEGKTTQSIASCIQHGITTIYVSASQLSGSHEHDSIDVMENIYKKALELRKNGEKVALIIDDFHLSNANIDENIKKTINSSLLTGYLMNLTQNKYDEKIPIILTGNDFSKIYGPLIRAGRAEHFKWNPNYEEKKIIVSDIFKDFICCENITFEHFFARCSNSSVAEFAQLRNEYRKLLIANCLKGIQIFDDKAIQNISKIIEKEKKMVTFEFLMTIAKERKMWRD